MKAALDDFQRVIFHPIDEAMFLVDAPRPEAGKLPEQGFGLANAVVWRTQTGVDEIIELVEAASVRLIPV